ncbi:MAG: hypothetical protein GY751_16335 [Bacteroidetes bacterium]|nr:hypothetical protein [Bacteroidota bacterium]
MNLFTDDGTPDITESLFQAYYDCRRNKRNTFNALRFEQHFEANLFRLSAEIQNGSYQPGRSIAFIVDHPVKREIFAADFRDRVVHHYVINRLNPLFEMAFIGDSYACRVGKGTHYGINRIEQFIRSCSEDYRLDCYVLKLDIQGFFMHISRKLLYNRLASFIKNKYRHQDQSLILDLCRKIVFNDPSEYCIIKGSRDDWKGLPGSKSLFHSPPGCGLPIGNLSSQVFANFYMNPFDHFVKKELGIHNYGRYVDDFVLVHPSKDFLLSVIPSIRDYLASQLQLELHPKKIYLQHYSKGVNFLGVVIKPGRKYIARRTVGNFYRAIEKQNRVISKSKPNAEDVQAFISSMNSYLGIMKHYKTFRLRRKMILKHLDNRWWNYLYLTSNYLKFVVKPAAENCQIHWKQRAY